MRNKNEPEPLDDLGLCCIGAEGSERMTPEQKKVYAHYFKLGEQLEALENEAYDAKGFVSTLMDGSEVPYLAWHTAAENLRRSFRRIEYRIKRIKELRKEPSE